MTDTEMLAAIGDVMAFIEEWGDQIMQREVVDGKPGSYSLNALPGKLAIQHAFKYIRSGQIPHRVVTEDEMRGRRREGPC